MYHSSTVVRDENISFSVKIQWDWFFISSPMHHSNTVAGNENIYFFRWWSSANWVFSKSHVPWDGYKIWLQYYSQNFFSVRVQSDKKNSISHSCIVVRNEFFFGGGRMSIEFFLSPCSSRKYVSFYRNENIYIFSVMAGCDIIFLCPMHASSTVARNENIYFTIEVRSSIEFLSSSRTYCSYTAATTFFDVGRQPIDKSCTQRYCTRGWHDAVYLRLYDTNG